MAKKKKNQAEKYWQSLTSSSEVKIVTLQLKNLSAFIFAAQKKELYE